MKKLICLVLIFIMMLTACSKWNVEIVDPTKPVENEQELIVSENEKEEKTEIDSDLVRIEIINSNNKSVTFELKNNSKDKISFGEDYYIESLDGKIWVQLKEINEYFFTMIAYGLESGGVHNFSVNFEEKYGALPDGTYRIVKDIILLNEDGVSCGEQRIYGEFEVEMTEKSHLGEPKNLNVTAKAEAWNRACGIKVFNNSDREIMLSAMWELYYETGGKFEKLDYVRGMGYDETMLSIAPGESYDLFSNTEGAYGLLPIGKYRIDCRVVFDNDSGFENEQTVSGEFEITGLEKHGTSFIWDKTAELSGTVITITFRNDWGHEIRYGEDYFIQKLEGEDWVTVEPLENPTFDTVLYVIDEIGDKYVEWKADLSLIYGELTKGNYRLVKTIFADAYNYINGKHYAFFEFEVE